MTPAKRRPRAKKCVVLPPAAQIFARESETSPLATAFASRARDESDENYELCRRGDRIITDVNISYVSRRATWIKRATLMSRGLGGWNEPRYFTGHHSLPSCRPTLFSLHLVARTGHPIDRLPNRRERLCWPTLLPTAWETRKPWTVKSRSDFDLPSPRRITKGEEGHYDAREKAKRVPRQPAG
jgi:hypothetical protein